MINNTDAALKTPSDPQDEDNFVSPEVDASTTGTPTPSRKRGCKKGSSLEVLNLQSGGMGGRPFPPNNKSSELQWMFAPKPVSDSDSSFDDDSSASYDSLSCKELGADFEEEEVDWCVSHLKVIAFYPLEN